MHLQGYIERATVIRWQFCALLTSVLLLSGCSAGEFSWGGLVDQLIIGLILGSIYALIALGYTLVYGVIKLINFAHADIYMLGAFIGYYVLRFTIRWLHYEHATSLMLCFLISLIVSAMACALIAVLMERLAYRPLRKSSRIAALITAVGVSFLLENAGILVFGASPKSYEPKTLPVYQVQYAGREDFAGAEQLEVYENPQRELPADEFSGQTFVRVRSIGRAGDSEWSPTLSVNATEDRGFIEAPADDSATTTARPNSLGYRRIKEQGQDKLILSWAAARPSDIVLPRVFSGADGQEIAYSLPITTSSGAPVKLPLLSIVIILATILTLFLLNLLVNKTMFGISMRALSFDMNAAKLMGVDTDRVISQTFAVGGVAAAIAGNLVGLYNQSIDPLMGILPGLKAFIAAVVGGIGSIPGAAVGGLIMGISESLVKGYIKSGWSPLADALAFAILILVLLFKPSGIFGKTLKEKV